MASGWVYRSGNGTTAAGTIAAPAGLVANDLLVTAVLAHSGDTITPPGGWTPIGTVDMGASMMEKTFYKVASGTETGSYAFIASTNTATTIVAYRNINASPFDVQAVGSATSGATMTAPALVTTAVANELILRMYFTWNSNTITSPVGVTSRLNVSSGVGDTIYVGDQIQVAAGSVGTLNATQNNSDIWMATTIAFKPSQQPSGQSVVETFSTGGSTNWIPPLDVGSVLVEMWSGGGGGGGATGTKGGGGGGAGGAYTISTVGLLGGGTYPLVVGGGGAQAALGGSSWFGAVGSAFSPSSALGTTSVANNGGSLGGAGGTVGAIGSLSFAGGAGARGVGGTATSATGGGGGGGASTTGVGGAATGTPSAGGTGASIGGGNGGNSGGTAGADGAVGTAIGGGGGGGFSNNTTDRAGGAGGAGQVRLTYLTNDIVVIGSQAVANNVGNAGTTQSFTSKTYNNKALFAWYSAFEPVNTGNLPPGTVTYGGASMTATNLKDGGATGTNVLYYLANPANGANNFVISLPGAVTSYLLLLFEAVNASPTQLDNSNIGTFGTVTSMAGTLTPVNDRSLNMWIPGASNGGWTMTGENSLVVVDSGGAFGPIYRANHITTPASAIAGTATGASDNTKMYAFSVRQFVAVVGSAVNVSWRMLMGVGQ